MNLKGYTLTIESDDKEYLRAIGQLFFNNPKTTYCELRSNTTTERIS